MTRKNEVETELLIKLAKAMIWCLLTLTSLLTYVVEIRPFLVSLLGIYFVGVYDGFFVAIIVLAIIFYLASRNNKK